MEKPSTSNVAKKPPIAILEPGKPCVLCDGTGKIKVTIYVGIVVTGRDVPTTCWSCGGSGKACCVQPACISSGTAVLTTAATTRSSPSA